MAIEDNAAVARTTALKDLVNFIDAAPFPPRSLPSRAFFGIGILAELEQKHGGTRLWSIRTLRTIVL
jgi:hypothetical protein